MGNANQKLNTYDNDFDNIESVEAIYSADEIDIIDTVSNHVMTTEITSPQSDQGAANEQNTSSHIYSLDNARLSKQSKSHERRAFKSRLTDRRSEGRVTASGEVQKDRRAVNQLANVKAIKLAHETVN